MPLLFMPYLPMPKALIVAVIGHVSIHGSNAPYKRGACAGVTALGNRRILTVALSSMPQEARMFGTGPFCSALLEPCMPGLLTIPDCQADPLYVRLLEHQSAHGPML